MKAAPRVRDALGVFALGLFVRLAFVAWGQARFQPVEDAHHYDTLARRLASGAGYTWLWPDGAVTYAAHYPVGYPALVALVYAMFGAAPAAAMIFNSFLGAASAYAAHRLVDGEGVARWRPLGASIAVALHPALVAYTVSLMTEGVTASLLVIATALAWRARHDGRSWSWIAGSGLTLGVATLVRPQSLLLAPVLGALACRTGSGLLERFKRAAVATAFALACVAPWTARNCVRMHRCALVSVNGGWNLLIGAQTTSGAWEPLHTPRECASVWDEAAKDACFEHAAYREIARSPMSWVARAPAKLAVTFDYFGAAPWYLHASNGAAFGDRAKAALAMAETAVCRVSLVAALTAFATWPGRRPMARKAASLVGVGGAMTLHGWIGYTALAASAALLGWRAVARAPVVVAMTAALIVVTALVHVLFFGAGRYGLVVVPFVAMAAFVRAGATRNPHEGGSLPIRRPVPKVSTANCSMNFRNGMGRTLHSRH
jgi:Dolichyl-phosphate-mannose-protein mannosyltransferase